MFRKTTVLAVMLYKHHFVEVILSLNVSWLTFKYKQLLCQENVAVLKRLSLFVSHIMKIVC